MSIISFKQRHECSYLQEMKDEGRREGKRMEGGGPE